MCVAAFELGSVAGRVYIAGDKKHPDRHSPRCHMYITREQTGTALGIGTGMGTGTGNGTATRARTVLG